MEWFLIESSKDDLFLLFFWMIIKVSLVWKQLDENIEVFV